jgi:hypothetical protein
MSRQLKLQLEVEKTLKAVDEGEGRGLGIKNGLERGESAVGVGRRTQAHFGAPFLPPGARVQPFSRS